MIVAHEYEHFHLEKVGVNGRRCSDIESFSTTVSVRGIRLMKERTATIKDN